MNGEKLTINNHSKVVNINIHKPSKKGITTLVKDL